MADNTIFGPQGANAATTLPAGSRTNRNGAAVDTWCRDCSAGGAVDDGTVLDAAFFNGIIGSLRDVVDSAIADGNVIEKQTGDMTVLTKAIRGLSRVAALGAGLANDASNRISLAFQNLPAMIDGALKPATDALVIYNSTTGAHEKFTVQRTLLGSLMTSNTLLTLTADATGRVDVSVDSGQLVMRAGSTMTGDLTVPNINVQGVIQSTPFANPAALPAVTALNEGAMAYVTGADALFSPYGVVVCDGVNWRRVRDNTVVA
jgi:hypothetical protein